MLKPSRDPPPPPHHHHQYHNNTQMVYLPVDGEPVEAGGGLEDVVGLQGAVHHHHLYQSCGQQLWACIPDRSQ
jgi:hypothetical protein